MPVAVVYLLAVLEVRVPILKSPWNNPVCRTWDKPGACLAAVSGLSQNVMGGRGDERSKRREGKRNMDSGNKHGVDLYATQILRPAHC